MASAMNHSKRSHRSDKRHRQCLHSMNQFAPTSCMGRMIDQADHTDRPAERTGPRKLLGGNIVSKHNGGWLRSTRKRNRKRAGDLEAAGV